MLLHLSDAELKSKLARYNPESSLDPKSIDELRYFFLASQVELTDSMDAINAAEYKSTSDTASIAIVKADGHKCDRSLLELFHFCWFVY